MFVNTIIIEQHPCSFEYSLRETLKHVMDTSELTGCIPQYQMAGTLHTQAKLIINASDVLHVFAPICCYHITIHRSRYILNL